LNLYPKDVLCLHAHGKVIQLPRGATPVDFAYHDSLRSRQHVHGARASNGRMAPLRTLIQNGDVVEIITTANSHPSP